VSSGPDAAPPIGPEATAASELFGDRLPLAIRYARLLTTVGTEHGLIGPREAERIWARHLLNCAAVADLLPLSTRLVDIGSGAGLPGLVLAIRRPDLRVDLVEPLQRRVNFLVRAVDELGLAEAVRVHHGRAEERTVSAAVGACEWVTARAVAPLARLVGWCLPLLAPGGSLLALKGRSAAAELDRDGVAVRRAGGTAGQVVECQIPGLDQPSRVIVIRRAAHRKQKGSS
jgi:16S rRNA (guanine527-N7)-methyltransferase